MKNKFRTFILKTKIKKELLNYKGRFAEIYRKANWEDSNLTTEEQLEVKRLAEIINRTEHILKNKQIIIKD